MREGDTEAGSSISQQEVSNLGFAIGLSTRVTFAGPWCT